MKFLREPLLHFMLIGVAIYLMYGIFAEPVQEPDDKTIVITAGELEWMKTSWQQRWNRPPTAEELDNLVQQNIRETVLYREALTMGLNQHDQVIRRRLAQKLEFLAKDLVALTPPTEEELQAYFEDHQQNYQAPALYTFTHVFIDPDKRGDATLPDAESIKAALVSRSDNIKDAGAMGDDFMLQSYYPQKNQMEIQKLFGSGFTQTLVDLAVEQWHGPVLSGYGTHLVYVSHASQPAPPLLSEAREQVVQDWTADKSQELNENFYTSLREQYTVVIEPAAEATTERSVQEPSR